MLRYERTAVVKIKGNGVWFVPFFIMFKPLYPYAFVGYFNKISLWELLNYIVYSSRFFRASGLFDVITSTIWHFAKSGQLPHVVTPFFNAHWRILQRLSQYTVLIPSTRQPSQLICSGRMGALFNSAHNFAVFARNAWSLLIVARYASHFSQSSPQYAIIFLMVMYLLKSWFGGFIICIFSLMIFEYPYKPMVAYYRHK